MLLCYSKWQGFCSVWASGGTVDCGVLQTSDALEREREREIAGIVLNRLCKAHLHKSNLVQQKECLRFVAHGAWFHKHIYKRMFTWHTHLSPTIC